MRVCRRHVQPAAGFAAAMVASGLKTMIRFETSAKPVISVIAERGQPCPQTHTPHQLADKAVRAPVLQRSRFISQAAGLGAALLIFNVMAPQPVRGEDATVHLIVLDPGHFHASLIQQSMYPQVSPVVHVYAPEGAELQDYLQRVQGFNRRAQDPTHWEEKTHAGADFLEAMAREKAGNVVVISGNNARKTEYIDRAIRAGFNVFADKPMAITPAGFKLLQKSFSRAAGRHLLLYDIMTERFQTTTILQRELARMPEVFGTLEKGSADKPAVVMESVHHFYKQASGTAVTRPAWFFDVRQQGEAIPDVGTHLVDLVQWECFPEQTLNWRKDIQVSNARRWAIQLTPAQFKEVTGLDRYPDFLKNDVDANGALNVFENGEVSYTLRGVHVKVTALWRFEAPPGGNDTHYSLLRGSRANLIIKQEPEQNYQPTLYVENQSDAPAVEFERTLRAAVAKLCATWPGLEVKPSGNLWEISVPENLRVSHEATFARVTENYLRYLAEGKMPDWEVPNMLAKYYTTTEAYRISHTATTTP